MDKIKRHTRKIFITIAGWAVLIVGVIMLVTPGPGWVFIILGLGILATEYAWAHRLVEKAKEHYENIKAKTLKKQKPKKPNSNNK